MMKQRVTFFKTLVILFTFVCGFSCHAYAQDGGSSEHYACFTNPNNWSAVYCYVWGNKGDIFGTWPGEKAKYTDGVYKVIIPDGMVPDASWKIIWNNGNGSQTGDLVYTDRATYDMFGVIGEILKCGEDLTWTFNKSTGELAISGTGDMYEWGFSMSVPWDSYRSDIKSVSLSNGVTNIGNYAFYYCSNLISILMPNTLTSIKDYAFFRCTNLPSVTIPKSVTTIGEATFDKCTSLTSIDIPNSVTYIGEYAFCECTSLTSLVIPNSVTSMGEWAFAGCIGLTSATISESLKSIADFAFYYCYHLTSVTIPNSVTSLGNWAFTECSSLNTITIPESVKSIGDSTFYLCYGLTSITCEAMTPPTCGTNSFLDVDHTIPLYVPEESITAYSVASEWEKFNNIQAIQGTTAIDAICPADEKKHKVLRNGHLLIQRDGTTYNMQGAVVNL